MQTCRGSIWAERQPVDRSQIKRGMLVVSGPPADLSLTKVNVVPPIEDVEAIDAKFDAEFKRQLALKAELERLQSDAKSNGD